MADYGSAWITRDDNGRLHVQSADPIIGISLELLAQTQDPALTIDDTGCILLAGDPRYRYRPVRFAANPGDPTETARVLVCERIEAMRRDSEARFRERIEDAWQQHPEAAKLLGNWTDDELTVARAASSVTRPGEGVWLNAGTFTAYWHAVARAVLDALAATEQPAGGQEPTS